ncbi:MAG: efflux RND transporter periplasmic adaptor subunit [Nitrosomonadales bacterium]|nr:efflux RND transporter periplasmic adaptor subunit [Nitrosomonadales bacterium]
MVIFVCWWFVFRVAVELETVAIGRGDIEINVTALGTLQPSSYVDVGAQVSGQIRRIHVQPGQRVEKGELLIEIDPSIQQALVDSDRASLAALKAQLNESQAQSDLAQQQYARQQMMAGEGATRDEDVQTAHATMRSAVAKVENLRAQIDGAQSRLKGNEAQLGYTRIYAPMAGTVISLDAREGQTLNATYQTPMIMRIADLATMTVWAEVSEVDVTRVKPGMQVYFTRLGTEGRRWEGEVRQVLPAPPTSASQGQTTEAAPAASSAGKVVSYTVLFDVTNQDGDLMPQMTAQVFFVVAQAYDVIIAPMPALTADDEVSGIYRAQVLNTEGKTVERMVRLGVRDRMNAEVLEGLAPGDLLVTGERNIRKRTSWFQL